jgi:hypothetical protein
MDPARPSTVNFLAGRLLGLSGENEPGCIGREQSVVESGGVSRRRIRIAAISKMRFLSYCLSVSVLAPALWSSSVPQRSWWAILLNNRQCVPSACELNAHGGKG